VLPMKSVLLVANISYAASRNLLHLIVGNRVGTASFTGQDDSVRRRHRFNPDAGMGVSG